MEDKSEDDDQHEIDNEDDEGEISEISAITEFWDQSTIHGLKQLAQADESLAKKFFWIFVLVGCFVGGSYEIYQVVSYFRLKPSATQVSWTIQSEYEFPPMAFCPKRWLDRRRVDELGLSESALAYVIGLLHSDASVLSAERKASTNNNEEEPKIIDESKAIAEINRLMHRRKIDTYAELIKRMAYDRRGLLRVINTPSNISLVPSIIEASLCYVIKVAPLQSGTLRTNVMMKLQYDSPPRTHAYDRRFQSKMLVKDWTGQRTSSISLRKNGIYYIDFTAEVHHRMSRPQKPCLSDFDGPPAGKWIRSTTDVCENECANRERIRRRCSHCMNLDLIDLLDLKMTQARPCSQTTTIASRSGDNRTKEGGSSSCDAEEMAKVMETCKSLCIPPCTQWWFKSLVNTLSETKTDEAVIFWITYNPIDGILSYEEVMTYTFLDFLSNIGGQLGLWLGVSVISVVQIFYYFGLACVHSLKVRKSRGSPT